MLDAALRARRLLGQFRIDKPKRFRLALHDPAETCGLDMSKEDAKAAIRADVARLEKQQERLYADGRWALLVIIQGMDASGKDSAIKHVMSGINPQGCEVTSFKAPSSEELAHDFLWRHVVRLPRAGRIGIFNRSYYEEVLVVRVHPEMLSRERLPEPLATKRIWSERFADICSFERYLVNNGTRVVKFFLSVSLEEQRRRFLERLENPQKHWKFSQTDLGERKLWPHYMAAYEDMIRNTSTAQAPWYVVPADDKWFCRFVIASVLADTLEDLHLEFPRVDAEERRAIKRARKLLAAEDSPRKGGKSVNSGNSDKPRSR